MADNHHYYLFILNVPAEQPPTKGDTTAGESQHKSLDTLCWLLFTLASFVVLFALVFFLGVWGVFVFPAAAALLAWLILALLYESVRQDLDKWVIGFLIVLALLGLAGYKAAWDFGLRRFLPPAANAESSTSEFPHRERSERVRPPSLREAREGPGEMALETDNPDSLQNTRRLSALPSERHHA